MRRERNLSPGGLVCISGWLFNNVTEGGLALVMEIATATQECCKRKLDKSSYSFRPSPVTFFVSKALTPKACLILYPNNLTNWGPSFQYISLWQPFSFKSTRKRRVNNTQRSHYLGLKHSVLPMGRRKCNQSVSCSCCLPVPPHTIMNSVKPPEMPAKINLLFLHPLLVMVCHHSNSKVTDTSLTPESEQSPICHFSPTEKNYLRKEK